MKLLFIVLTAFSFSFISAKEVNQGKPKAKKAYQRPYGMAGCGLGSIVIPRQGSQVFAATTNGTAASQLFGITSGTSNCVDDSSSEVASKMDNYIQGNKSQFIGDAAKGNGETIIALSEVMGCSESSKLGRALKANYQNLFLEENTNIVTDNIITLIQNDDQLSQQCKLTI